MSFASQRDQPGKLGLTDQGSDGEPASASFTPR
jgi:hypothetical protein